MEFSARWQDGLVGEVRPVRCVIDLAAAGAEHADDIARLCPRSPA